MRAFHASCSRCAYRGARTRAWGVRALLKGTEHDQGASTPRRRNNAQSRNGVCAEGRLHPDTALALTEKVSVVAVDAEELEDVDSLDTLHRPLAIALGALRSRGTVD